MKLGRLEIPMSAERVHLLIEELGNELGLPGMKLDDEGVCVINTADGLDVVLNYVDDDDMLIVYSLLGSIPDDRQEEMCATILKANFGWPQTRGSTLSVSRKGRQVVLQTYARCDLLDLPTTVAMLEHFFQRASYWAEAIAQPASDSEATALPNDEPSDPSMFV